MKTVAIIQARMGSTRLPGKVLRPLAGEPMLARVVRRASRATRLDAVVVATSKLVSDDPIVTLCTNRGWSFFRGSEDDVLDRYVHAARAAEADVIVRITSDCPLIDAGVVDEIVGRFLSQQPATHYMSNTIGNRTYPRGLDIEVVQRAALERAHREATDPASREHVTAFLYRHPELFQVTSYVCENDYSQHRWTVDTPEDYALIERIYAHFGDDGFGWRDVLALLAQHPGWSDLNRHVQQKTVPTIP